MPLIDIIRAKSKRYERILLKEHIEDVIDRIIQIWIFTQKNKDSIDYDFIKSEEIFKNLTKAAFLHDLGKIDYGFQKKVFEKEERVKENENWNDIVEFFTIDKYPTDFGIPDHEILSIIHTVAFLGNDKWDKRIRTAILLHHYNKFFAEREQHITRMLDDYPNIVDYVKFLISKREQFKEIYEDLIKYLENEFKKKNPPQFIYDALGELKRNLDTNKFTNLLERIDNRFGISKMLSLYELYDKEFNELTEFFVFLGLLRRCDYSASGEIIVEKDVSLGSIMQDLPDIIKRNIKIHSEKIWQEEILERHAEKNLILIAPTGSGKTEFALLWARRNSRKLLYTLPLRVALNDLFNRFAGENGYFNKETVDLLHSTSFIEYLKGENGKDISIDEKLKEIKMFASPILLTTPDQVFLSSLKFYGFDKLLSVYPFSSIVIDEIQAYDPEMAAIIKRQNAQEVMDSQKYGTGYTSDMARASKQVAARKLWDRLKEDPTKLSPVVEDKLQIAENMAKKPLEPKQRELYEGQVNLAERANKIARLIEEKGPDAFNRGDIGWMEQWLGTRGGAEALAKAKSVGSELLNKASEALTGSPAIKPITNQEVLDRVANTVGLESELGMLTSDYLRMQSGTAVAEPEFIRLIGGVLAGLGSQDPAQTAKALKTFADVNAMSARQKAETFGERGYGYTAAKGYKRLSDAYRRYGYTMPDSTKMATVRDTSYTKPMKKPEGQTSTSQLINSSNKTVKFGGKEYKIGSTYELAGRTYIVGPDGFYTKEEWDAYLRGER